jgi:sulfite exporter TauE/SafE
LVALPRVLPLFKIQVYSPKFLVNGVNKLLSKALANKAGHFYVGLLNGFLPCGFVYLGLAMAVNSSSAFQSGLFMFFFGLGTLPLMLAAMVGFNFAKPAIRFQINRILPILTIFLGIWFIFKGLNLDIPYLSPMLLSSEVICH